jgi:hypothetical protein
MANIHGDNYWLERIAGALSSATNTNAATGPKTGSKNSIGTTALQLSSTSFAPIVGVMVKASSVNADWSYAKH